MLLFSQAHQQRMLDATRHAPGGTRRSVALVAVGARAYDFSVINVLENSHTDKPLLYKITGVWGNHEGSMVLWVIMLGVCSAAMALFSGNLE